jgi:hypothetical protein
MRLAKEAAEVKLANAATDTTHHNIERNEIQMLKRPKGKVADKHEMVSNSGL